MKMMLGLREADTALVVLSAFPHRKLKPKAIPTMIIPRHLAGAFPKTFMVILV